IAGRSSAPGTDGDQPDMPIRRIRELIDSSLADLAPAPLLVAFSGGLDSHVLLHALATSPVALARGLRAVYIDHGLQDDSAQWAERCRGYARALGVELLVCEVDVVRRSGLGLEASARRARYAK